MAIHRRCDLGDGQVGAEHADVVARAQDHAGDHLEAHDVLLALRSREQDALRGALPGDAEGLALERQHSQRDRGREVLLGDRDAPVGPEVAHQHERGPDHLVVDHRLAETGLDGLADHRLGRVRLTGQQRVGVGALQLRRQRRLALPGLIVVIGDHRTTT
jgi:hypothetical protein